MAKTCTEPPTRSDANAKGCGGTPPRTRVRLVVLALCPAHANPLKIRVPHTIRDGFQIGGGFAEANATRQIGDYRTHEYFVARVARHVPQHAQEVVHGVLKVGGSGGGLGKGEDLGDGLEVSGHWSVLSVCVTLDTYIMPYWQALCKHKFVFTVPPQLNTHSCSYLNNGSSVPLPCLLGKSSATD